MTESAKKLAWETAVYLVVVASMPLLFSLRVILQSPYLRSLYSTVIVAIISGTVVFVGHIDWTIPTRRRAQMESKGPGSPYLPSGTGHVWPVAVTL
jgi:hypothetical protein